MFVCGVEVSVRVREFSVDAGRGWEWSDWCEHRDEALSESSVAARAVLVSEFARPRGGEYVDGREGAGWLDRASVS